MKNLCYITLKSADDLSALEGLVVVDSLQYHPLTTLVSLSGEEIESLRRNDSVSGVETTTDVEANETEDVELSVEGVRAGFTKGSGYDPSTGNAPGSSWSIARHTGLTNNYAGLDTVYTKTATFDNRGDGVDIVLIGSTCVDYDNPGYKTDSVTRLEKFQWNTLTGMSGIATIDYEPASGTTSSHAELVMALAAHNERGWASDAKIYQVPRNQIPGATDRFEVIRQFHLAKIAAGGTVRPTVAFLAYGYSIPAGNGINDVTFRDRVYTTYKGEAVEGDRAPGFVGFGIRPLVRVSGDYLGLQTSVTDLTDAGVHLVVTPGNYTQKLDVATGLDYDNEFKNVRMASSPVYNSNRVTALASEHTIVVGNMQSSFNELETEDGEYFRASSSRGPRVDCACGGTYLTIDYPVKYSASGTSFSAPQIAGMLAILLSKYPTTTPLQGRKYFRDVAVGTTKLQRASGGMLDIDSDLGDPTYFDTVYSLQGYSGNIAYLDPDLTFDPTTLSVEAITYPADVIRTDGASCIIPHEPTSGRLDYTRGETNTLLCYTESVMADLNVVTHDGATVTT